MITEAWALEFAERWIAAWNSHDLERILEHYSDDFEMSSPLIVERMNVPWGMLRGKAAIRPYWAKSVAAKPPLKFELLAVHVGANRIAIVYRSVGRRFVVEVLTFNEAGVATHGAALYGDEVSEGFGHAVLTRWNNCRLISPTNEASWSEYHRIRRAVLFENRGEIGVYDPNHPSDREARNHAKVLMYGDECVGVVRIDFAGDNAYLRRVAIDGPWQRRGLGRALIRLAERFAREHGAQRIGSNVARDAVPFYEKCGYRVVAGTQYEGASVPMEKQLG